MLQTVIVIVIVIVCVCVFVCVARQLYRVILLPLADTLRQTDRERGRETEGEDHPGREEGGRNGTGKESVGTSRRLCRWSLVR